VVLHRPALHTWPAEHALPQPPQWATSREKSTHDAPHTDCPVAQPSVQTPALQS
jgi:hypothetical protein